MAGWYTAVVTDNADPDKRGRLRLKVAGLTGDEEWPEWVEPALPAPAMNGAIGWWWIPPKDALVLVERYRPDALRWRGGTSGGRWRLPTELSTDYPKRAGFTDPSGTTVLALASSKAVLKAQEVLLGGEQDATEAALLGDKFVSKFGQLLSEIVSIGAAAGVPATTATQWGVELAIPNSYTSRTVKVKP